MKASREEEQGYEHPRGRPQTAPVTWWNRGEYFVLRAPDFRKYRFFFALCAFIIIWYFYKTIQFQSSLFHLHMPSSDPEDISRAEKMGESRTRFLDEERVKKIRPISTPRNASVSLNPRRRERPAPEKKNAAQSAVLVKLKGVFLCSPILCSRLQWYMPIKKPDISVDGMLRKSIIHILCLHFTFFSRLIHSHILHCVLIRKSPLNANVILQTQMV